MDINTIIDVVLIVIGAVTLTYLSLFIHELGHLVFGFATGYQFNFFHVGFLYWQKENDKIKFKVVKKGLSGQCLMVPSKGLESFNFFWYNFGGSFFNLLVGVLLLIGDASLEVSRMMEFILFVGGLINLFFFVINIVPFRALENDGSNIYAALSSEEAKRGLYFMFYLDAAHKNSEERLRDFPEEAFKVKQGVKLNHHLIKYLILCEAVRLKDLGEYHLAIKELERLSLKKCLLGKRW